MENKRSSGILLHLSSLPSSFGIGDMGSQAHQFLEFLKASGYTYWQLLPLNPVEEIFGFSPYSSSSAFAGNTLLISPELLEQQGWLQVSDFALPKDFSLGKAAFSQVHAYKNRLLEAAFLKFEQNQLQQKEFDRFCIAHARWLEDFSLYTGLREKYQELDWTRWPKAIRNREKKALETSKKAVSRRILKEKFFQFLFFSQWEKLRQAAGEMGISFIGDIPFYINHASADCWAHPEYFKLDAEKQPVKISGVPPDYFSETGQLWGTPVFDWENLKENQFDWWLERISQNLKLFDAVRLDHFRGFSASWEVSAGEKTAQNGKWVKNPGIAFFSRLKKEFSKMPFIAEDLGSLDAAVYHLLEKFKLPGMKVLQFAFGENLPESPYIPHNYTQNNIVYPGTHDNYPTRAWFNTLEPAEKKRLQKYCGQATKAENVAGILHKMALQSVARLAIIPMQDILGLGAEAIMNIPGTSDGNWSWRLQRIPWELSENLKQWNVFFGRFPEKDSQSLEK